jgi:hypothetical protein
MRLTLTFCLSLGVITTKTKNLCGYTYTKIKKLHQIMEKSSKNIVNNRYSEMKKGFKEV